MRGEGVPTLQADQLNVIAHHLNEITTSEDLWPEKNDWLTLMNSPKILPIQLKVKILRQKMLKKTPQWKSFFGTTMGMDVFIQGGSSYGT